VATVVVGKWCGELDEKQLHMHLNNETAAEADAPEDVLDLQESHLAVAAVATGASAAPSRN
jgi:aerobic C4-dicarboxylate transport protein